MRNVREMKWTCPKCQARNARPIPGNTPDGRLIAVRCAACKSAYYATAVVHAQGGEPPAVYGVTWV